MGLLIVILLASILGWVIPATFYVKHIHDVLVDKKPQVSEPGKATDPFTRPKEINSSTKHIIVPKTPTEIRNQNFKRIKEGIEYGDIIKE